MEEKVINWTLSEIKKKKLYPLKNNIKRKKMQTTKMQVSGKKFISKIYKEH